MNFVFLQVGSIVGETFGDLAGRLLQGIWGIVVALVIAGVVIGTFWYIRYRRSFNIKVEIQSSRSGGVTDEEMSQSLSDKDYVKYVQKAMQQGNYRLIYDKAALKRDKNSKTMYFRLLGEKIEMTVPPFNVLQPSNEGMVLKIWQKSAVEYFFLMPGKINKEFIIRADGKMHPVAEVEQYQLEGDDPEWIYQRQQKNKSWLNPDHWAMKLLQYAPAIIISVITLFLIWIVLGKLPPLIDRLGDLAVAITEAQRGTITSNG